MVVILGVMYWVAVAAAFGTSAFFLQHLEILHVSGMVVAVEQSVT